MRLAKNVGCSENWLRQCLAAENGRRERKVEVLGRKKTYFKRYSKVGFYYVIVSFVCGPTNDFDHVSSRQGCTTYSSIVNETNATQLYRPHAPPLELSVILNFLYSLTNSDNSDSPI